VRPVTQAAQRRSEAARLGYAQVVDERSRTLRAALGDIRARGGRQRVPLEDMPPF
jgi:DNA repair protein RadA/Sms